MRSFEGRVAAITGAGSGIGRALARELAARGAHLALSDIDETTLAETVALCEGHPVKVTSATVDVASREAVHAWADEVVAEHGAVNLVFNNAGVAVAASIEAVSYADFEWLMNINFWGVVHGTKAFLPHLKAADEGHIVNLSSVFGLISVPSQAVYNASKFAVRGFTDALRIELEAERSTVSCTTVHPGGIKTNIARNARFDPSALSGRVNPAEDFHKIALTTPEKAARQILAAVERDRRRVLVGPDAKAIDLLSRLPAGLYQRAFARGAARQRSRGWSTAEDPCGPDGLTLPDGERTTVTTDDGGELAVLVAGSDDAPTVVLAHCWMGRMQMWGAVARELVAAGYRVVLYDQRGHGDSAAGSAPFTVERIGDDLHEIVTALDLRDLVVVGHSMGGMTIQAFAARHPAVLADRVRGVVLVATSAHNGRIRVPRFVADRVFGERSSARLAARDLSRLRRAVGREAHRGHLQATHDALMATSAAARAGFLVAMTRMDFRASLARIGIPTRIVVGTHDRLTPPARARVLASTIPGAQLQELDGYGHMLPLEAPREVAAAIWQLAPPCLGVRGQQHQGRSAFGDLAADVAMGTSLS